jgi:fatty-acyl-CoA synthase
MRLVDDAGKLLPHDGTAVGDLQVRGPIVVQQYHRHEQRTVDGQRWFSTGDVASIDQHGTMKISDRWVGGEGDWIRTVTEVQYRLL